MLKGVDITGFGVGDDFTVVGFIDEDGDFAVVGGCL